jgi:hypothetical protein
MKGLVVKTISPINTEKSEEYISMTVGELKNALEPLNDEADISVTVDDTACFTLESVTLDDGDVVLNAVDNGEEVDIENDEDDEEEED